MGLLDKDCSCNCMPIKNDHNMLVLRHNQQSPKKIVINKTYVPGLVTLTHRNVSLPVFL